MRLNKVKSKNATSYYIIRSVRRNGKNSSEIVRKLGTEESIRDTYGVDDVDVWANEQLRIMNEEEAANDHNVLVSFNTSSMIEADKRLSFNVGYLFLQQMHYPSLMLDLPLMRYNIIMRNNLCLNQKEWPLATHRGRLAPQNRPT